MFQQKCDVLTLYLRNCNGQRQILTILADLPKLFTLSPSFDSKKLNIIENQLTDCISMLNFFDDIPMFHWLRSYGWGKKDSDYLIRFCNLFINVMTISNHVLDHITWAGRHNILAVNMDKWNLVATCISISTSNVMFFKSLKRIKIIQKNYMHKKMQDKNNNYNKRLTGPYKHCNLCILQIKTYNLIKMKKLKYLLLNDIMTCTRVTLQTICFVNCLPKGILWGGHLTKWQLGVFGIVSSLIQVYRSNLIRELQQTYLKEIKC